MNGVKREMSQEEGKKDVHMESIGNVPQTRASNVNQRVCDDRGVSTGPATEGIRWAGVCSKWCPDYRRKTRRACGTLASAKMLMPQEAVAPPLPSMIVVSHWHDANVSPTFINSWQQAPPEFPTIPWSSVWYCHIYHYLPEAILNHSVPLMVEVLTWFFALCSLDSA